jgi:integrase
MVRRSKKTKARKRVSNATVNRTTIEPLKRILFRARDLWGQRIGLIDWKKHKLAEPEERVRSASVNEEERYFAALPVVYHEIAYYSIRMGTRAMESVNLRRADIDWGARLITITGKGDKTKTVPMPLDVRDMLYPMVPNDEGYLFMLPERERKKGRIEPRRRITYRGFYSAHRRACETAGIEDLRIHDFRHTAATRLLRLKGNLKMAQKLLRHSNIKTTAKYAHVLDEELRDAMDEQAVQKVPEKVPHQKDNVLIKKTK